MQVMKLDMGLVEWLLEVNKMIEIPEDIIQVAKELSANIGPIYGGHEEISRTIFAERMAERERCRLLYNVDLDKQIEKQMESEPEFVKAYSILKQVRRGSIPKEVETFFDRQIAIDRMVDLSLEATKVDPYFVFKIAPVKLVKKGDKYYRVNVNPYNVRDAADVFGIKEETNADCT